MAHSLQGSFGILPHRLDCAAALAPGILTYDTEEDGAGHLAVDQGVLVKAGMDVLVSVRNVIGVTDRDEQAKKVRSVLAKVESGFLHRLREFQRL